MDKIVTVGATARIDPDPSAELAIWREDMQVGRIDEPAATQERLEAQARGEQVIVRLDLFAEVASGERLSRYDGMSVRGAWFEAGAREANVAHAREMVSSSLDTFYRELTEGHGLEVAYEDLAAMPIAIELDDELARL